MIHSIRERLMLSIFLIVGGIVVFSLLINTLFLEKYYLTSKTKTVVDTYHQVEEIFESSDNKFTEDVITQLNSVCEASGVTLLIVSESGDTEFTYGPTIMLSERVRDMIFSSDTSNSEYSLQMTTDNPEGEKYVELYSMLGNSHYLIMRVAVESLKESVSVSNRFFTYVGMIAVFVSLFIVYFISNRYTKPILRLADLSKEMSELNFSVKYQENRNDEIDVLGNSMNEMSSKLEQTINELKDANEQLQKDIELKNQIDEMRKEFISNVSHELKTPIALIQGYAEGLNEGINDDPEGSQFYCDVIIDEANKMNKLVKKLLALTQIEFGNSQVNMEEFDLASVISGVLNSTKILMEEKNIKLEFDDSKVWNIYADEFQTEEVITNFVSNAINHSFTEDDKNKTIRISIEGINEFVRFKVFNTGKHIPENDLENVWIKFFKVDKARTREYGGSGIGLSIVKAIADSMKVKCGVNNVEGGVEFWFDFILAENANELTEWF